MPEESEALDRLVGADWDIPLTDEFVSGVQRGVRRRRALRRVGVGGGAAAVVAGVAALVLTLDGGSTTLVVPPASSASTPASAASAPVASDGATSSGSTLSSVAPSGGTPAVDRPLDGFRIGYVPEGIRPGESDSSVTCAVPAEYSECRDPRSGGPTATVSSREFDKGVSRWLVVAVARPLRTTPTADRAEVARRLVTWETAGRAQVSSYDVPAGRARVLVTAGSEGLFYSAVVVTGDSVVISVSGVAQLTADEVRTITEQITPVR